ncbi:histone-lysine N-methyltransferase SETMAR [Trichonephila clavipes]|nr:histone-lysine N-methyltransferase SETMAR [Trichonephila clavipes]
MDFTEINSRGKRRELFGRIDRQNSRFRTAKTIIIKLGLHASFVKLKSAKNALNELAEIVNGVYGSDTVTANYVQFWFHRFRSGIFDIKDAPRTGRTIVESIDKITEIIEVDRHKLLPQGQNLNSDLYCQQLDRLKLAIDQKRPELVNRRGVVFHQDTARPRTFAVTHQNFWELGWEVLMHPPYSSDLAPSDYHLFLALQSFLSDKKLRSREDCEDRLLDVQIHFLKLVLCIALDVNTVSSSINSFIKLEMNK